MTDKKPVYLVALTRWPALNDRLLTTRFFRFWLVFLLVVVIPKEAIVSEIIFEPVALDEVMRKSAAVVRARKKGSTELKVEATYAGFKISFRLPLEQFVVEEVLLSAAGLTVDQVIEVADPGVLEVKKNDELHKKGVSISRTVARYGSFKRFSRLKKREQIVLFLAGPRRYSAARPWDPWKLNCSDSTEAQDKEMRSLWMLALPDAFEWPVFFFSFCRLSGGSRVRARTEGLSHNKRSKGDISPPPGGSGRGG